MRTSAFFKVIMGKVLLTLSAFLIVSFTVTIDAVQWQVLLNNDIIFQGPLESDNTTVQYKSVSLKDTDSLIIKYNAKKVDKRWKRLVYINDSSDRNLKTLTLNEQTGSVSVNASLIKTNIHNKQPVFIYTTAIPKDRKLAARIRVRRILVCKIEWN